MTYTALYLILTAHSILGLAAIALCVRLSRQLRMTREKVDHLQSHLAFMNSSICQLETKLDMMSGQCGYMRNEDDRK